MLILRSVVPIMSHLAQILFLFYIFIFALNQERKTVSVKEYAYDIIYINLKCPDNIIKLLVAVFLKVLIFGHFPLHIFYRSIEPAFCSGNIKCHE